MPSTALADVRSKSDRYVPPVSNATTARTATDGPQANRDVPLRVRCDDGVRYSKAAESPCRGVCFAQQTDAGE